MIERMAESPTIAARIPVDDINGKQELPHLVRAIPVPSVDRRKNEDLKSTILTIFSPTNLKIGVYFLLWFVLSVKFTRPMWLLFKADNN